MDEFLIYRENQWFLRVWVQPNASKSEVVGEHNGYLKIKLQAPPVDGKANEELIKFLAKFLKIRKSDLALIKGDTSRGKTLQINFEGDLKAKIHLVL